MRIDTVHGPAAQPVLQAQKATVRREDLTSKSSISGTNKPNFFLQLPFALFRMATFVLSLIIYRTPKLKGIYIPEMTSADRKMYEQHLSGYWTDFALFRRGPSYAQKIQLFHQFYSFQKHSLTWIANGWAPQKSMTIVINGKKQKFHLEKEMFMGQEIEALKFLEVISNPKYYGKGSNKVELHCDLRHTFDFTIGPYRKRHSSLTCKNTLGADGTSFTSEVTNKRTRTSYHFFR